MVNVARAMGKLLDRVDSTDRSDPVAHYAAYARWLEHADPAVVANTLLCLIHQANYLLDQQIRALERDFVEDGGYSEQLAVARMAERRRQKENPADPQDLADRNQDEWAVSILRVRRDQFPYLDIDEKNYIVDRSLCIVCVSFLLY